MLRDLYRQGLSISEIARQTGYNRRTVSKYVNARVPPVSRKPSAKPSKLDSYKDYIIQRLNSGPLTACRIYRELQDKGFTGKYTIVKDFVRKVRPPSSVPAVYRFETKPGKQAQADWAECGRIEIDGNIQKLYLLQYGPGLFANDLCRVHPLYRYPNSNPVSPECVQLLQRLSGRDFV